MDPTSKINTYNKTHRISEETMHPLSSDIQWLGPHIYYELRLS